MFSTYIVPQAAYVKSVADRTSIQARTAHTDFGLQPYVALGCRFYGVHIPYTWNIYRPRRDGRL